MPSDRKTKKRRKNELSSPKLSPRGFTAESLEYAIDQLHGLNCAVHRELLRSIVEFEACESYTADGARDVAFWLTTRLFIPLPLAKEWVRVAFALEELPRIAHAYAAGELSWAQTAELTKIATPEDERELLDRAGAWTPASIATLARRARTVSRAEADDDDRKRELFMRWSEDTLRLSGSFYGADGAVVEKAITRISERLYRESNPDSEIDAYWQRSADALVELCSQDLDADCDADRSTLVVHVEGNSLVDGEGNAQIEDGPVISLDTARRLGCDGRVEMVAEDRTGKTIGIGQKSRKIPPWLYRQLRHRDRCCRFFGCGTTRGVNGHHIVHWSPPHNGPTELPNLLLLCRRHHKLVHERGWSVFGDGNGEVTFVRPDGTEARAGPPPLDPGTRERLLPEARAG